MISVTLIVKDGERKLREVLEAVSAFDEVVLVDTGSQDQTLSIAKTFPNVSLHERPFTGFGELHNLAARLAKHPWILSIDADEVLSNALAKEILETPLDESCVYALPFKNFLGEKWIRWCGWQNEKHVRLYHRDHTAFSEAKVHEKVQDNGFTVVTFKESVHHYSYASISDFLVKMERYSTLFAKEYAGKRTSSPWIAFYHAIGAFLKSYLLKRGFLGGYEGFLISKYNGDTAFYKYLKLYHRNRQC